MKGVIYYFSGTGNTEKVVKEYAKCFEKAGSTLETRKIDIDSINCKDKTIDLSKQS